MGLRDQYLASMLRCFVAAPMVCNTQPEQRLLHVAPPIPVQDATGAPDDATTSATPAQQRRHVPGAAARAHAAPDATGTQQDWQRHATTVQRDLQQDERRRVRIIWLGHAGCAEDIADKLRLRDSDLDDRRLCVECAHAQPGFRCAKWGAFLLHRLQRCPSFEESKR